MINSESKECIYCKRDTIVYLLLIYNDKRDAVCVCNDCLKNRSDKKNKVGSYNITAAYLNEAELG